ncbi:tRNA 4-thiouridine(8) synthase ThiI [candidate division KSB1 bacterium]|nr:tRNA 4-thiouridine(8) synthase ThiI [candidate division KSB1 bacterium]NIR71188.1 tRNA 4-thiouridine(8) synthase ThiI [candidate division KSB1 bacterium]NIS26173.1 tRNA 4-thiouridine(8) synthase ThiI [candidate division KSB1 bacterium]NIT72938.1 tRNA 4-thiouridine(8) synthase ThiI [candidate division KSB1 bacterium]NIU26820.1 tRNA 4-thiouridine(8) synthase ThiI [candidate division KSB1 bacterium]
MNFKCVVIHYGEIALKGKNRNYFEKKLKDNIKKALHGIPIERLERLRGRFVLHLDNEANEETIKSRLAHVFGITYFSFGRAVPKELETIKATAWSTLKDQEFDSFKIDSRRAQKEFPLSSMELNKQVGAYVQEKCGKRVDLTNPGATCVIEIAGPYALVYGERNPGLRGLPVGVSEQAVSLLSSGIDSPVASYLMLKRGVNLSYVHFHSQPFTNKASQENAEKLIRVLNRYQIRSKVYFLPFIDIQKEIMANAPVELRVLLYRRYMVRLAERVARAEEATALVTGENVGQVASQTLSNIRVVAEVTNLPVLRPLAGFDKEEIVHKAREIGTFEISTEPYEDCCSLFVPPNPETRSHPKALREAEDLLEVDELMEKTFAEAEIKIFDYRKEQTT